MESLRKQIGTLSALFAFEAAGRLGSFTRAACELGVTQAAVSKQIAQLEILLGRTLFLRLHRRVQMTDAGIDLFKATSGALSGIAATMRQLRVASVERPVTIAATTTMSHYWLLPRIPALKELHSNLSLRIVSQDEPLDLRDEDVDMVIRYGTAWDDGLSTLLFEGAVYAMASPSFLAARPELSDVDSMLASPLIAYDSRDSSWVSWGDWLRAAKICRRAPVPTLSFTRYMDAILAAGADQGVVLVWDGLTGGLAERGALVRVPGPTVKTDGDFFVVSRDGGEEQSNIRLVARWLIEEGQKQAQAALLNSPDEAGG